MTDNHRDCAEHYCNKLLEEKKNHCLTTVILHALIIGYCFWPLFISLQDTQSGQRGFMTFFIIGVSTLVILGAWARFLAGRKKGKLRKHQNTSAKKTIRELPPKAISRRASHLPAHPGEYVSRRGNPIKVIRHILKETNPYTLK